MSTISSSTSTPATTTTASSSTTPSSIGAQLVTSLGLGTGINMNDLATQMAQASYATATQNVTNQLSAVQVQISEASTLQNNVASLVSSFASLMNGGSLSSSPTVTNASVATASLPPGTSGAASSYSLEVNNLASAQVLASPALGSGTNGANATTGSGTLTINFGTISGASFTADASQSPVNITVNPGDSLSQIAASINGAGAGITAYVASTATGAQLVMKGPTGANSAFTVSAAENPGDPGLSALAWNPATGAPSRLAEKAQDASFSIDGIAQTSAGNTVANAAPGLSLVLTGTNAGNPTTVTYSDPSSAITNAMTNLTAALNSIVGTLNTDLTASSSGSLVNDSGARAMAAQLAQLPGATIMPNAAAGAPSTLADLGLVVGKDGTYTLDSTKLQSALTKNPSAVAAMFTDGLYGIYGTLENMSIAISSTTDPGSLAGSVTTYTAQQTSLTSRQSQIASQQSAMQASLISQFATANSSVAQSKSTLSYLQNQIAAWNSPTGGLA